MSLARLGLCWILCAGTAAAQQSDWQGGSANWTNAGSWTNGVPNSPTAIAVLGGTNTYTATLNSAITLQELQINNANATLSHTTGIFTVGIANINAGTYRLAGGTLNG